MSSHEFLGEFEQIVLLAVLRLQKDAYGVPIRREIEHRVKRTVTVGALYSTLDRLEAKGYVSSWFADPTAERGGRSKRFFRVEPLGLNAIRRSQEALAMMLEGLDLKNV
jgi:PadR family transcriptional regulator PadR